MNLTLEEKTIAQVHYNRIVAVKREPESSYLLLKIKNFGATGSNIKIILGERKSSVPLKLSTKRQWKKFHLRDGNDSKKGKKEWVKLLYPARSSFQYKGYRQT